MSDGFESLNIDPRIMKSIEEMGFVEPTPVQLAAIPLMMKGKDVIAQAQTGTGKTAAFAIPILQKIEHGMKPTALVLVPTRELAIQVSDETKRLASHLDIKTIPVYGGQAISVQFEALKRGVDVITGTPGRVIDHIKRRTLDLSRIRFLVLDEADRMLDMGFIEDIEFIMKHISRERNTYLFSATIPDEIRRIGKDHMKNPEVIIISEEELVLPSTKQVYYNVGRKNKIWALCRVLDKDKPKAIVFSSTKRMVDILDQRLKSYGYPAEALHGDLSQAQRERVLTDFRKGKIKVLIATDVAARGLDIEDVTLVINYDIPESPEWYVHRVGRTGRAGKEGKAITFVSSDEKHLLEGIKVFGKAEIEQAEVPTTGEKDVVRKVWDFDEYVDIYGMVMFRINLGKADKFGMNDVVELIRIRAEISEIAIGHVEIGETSSEFEIHKEVAYKAMKILDQSRFRGKTISIEPVPRAK